MADIVYEPHPVTPERKAELRKAGKTIIDAAFKPAGLVAEEAGEPAPELTRESIAKMGRKDLVQHLEAHGVVGATGKIKDLRNWLTKTVFVEM